MTLEGLAVLAAYAALLGWLTYRGNVSKWSPGSTRALVWSAAPGLLFAVIYVGLQVGAGKDTEQKTNSSELVGVDANVTRKKLRELSDALIAADKKGDAALAQTVMNQAVDIMVVMENQPRERSSGLRDCSLAAQHLATGAESIARGGRWRNQDQFQTAASDCRT